MGSPGPLLLDDEDPGQGIDVLPNGLRRDLRGRGAGHRNLGFCAQLGGGRLGRRVASQRALQRSHPNGIGVQSGEPEVGAGDVVEVVREVVGG